MKYKVGDKVRVISGLVVDGAYGNWGFTEKMKKYKGKSVTISEVCQDYYHIKEDEEYGYYTDEMFESVEEMSAEEAIKTLTEMCNGNACSTCPLIIKAGVGDCYKFRIENSEKAVEIIKQWKVDHEKKPIEINEEWWMMIVDKKTHTLVHEERLKEAGADAYKRSKEAFSRYCAEHEGEFYAVREFRTVVKE